ncbi:MAG: hypothetical protein FWE09_07770 [Treponema sp.]|nr:hypothetical protein [Treponema sp.]
MKKSLFFPLALILALASPLRAQDAGGDALFVITAFDLDVTGRTRPAALMREGNLVVGQELRGIDALDAYLRDRTQALTNLRTLRDTVRMSYAIGPARPDGSYPVTIVVRTEDSLNVIAFPVPEYSSHGGWGIDLRARDYNFLGSMRPLRVDLGYRSEQDGQSSFEALLDLSLPFDALGYRWGFRFENFLSYRPGLDEPFFFRNVTGLSLSLPAGFTTFTLGFHEAFVLNQENPSSRHDPHGRFQSGLYMASTIFASWSVPTGLRAGDYGELAYAISPSATFNHELSAASPVPDFRAGPFLGLSHSLGFGRTNWLGNFRQGFSFSLGNSFSHDVSRFDDRQDPFRVSLSAVGSAHFVMNGFMGASLRLQYRHWFSSNGHGFHGNGADVLRGIKSDSFTVEHMLSLNTGFPVKAFSFLPSRWFNVNWMRVFDFEFHVSPFADMAIYNDPSKGQNIAATGGLEFFVFPGIARAIYLRASFGVNILKAISEKKIPDGDNREITIGLGHFF